jgi:centractin
MATGAAASQSSTFVGEDSVHLRGVCKLHSPMLHGVVEDWQDMTSVWSHAYKHLKAVEDQHPILLTEAPLNPRANRAAAAEVFFETFSAPALFIQIQSILSLYTSGRTTGVVLDSGDGVTSAVPVFEGFALPHAIQRIDVGGRDVTEHLQLLLRKAGHVFHTSSELEVVRDIKEKLGYLALDVEKEERGAIEDDAATRYALPDGSTISVGAERFRAPEVLFNPALIGLEYPGAHQMLVNAITKADLDIRRVLYQDIILSGGATMTQKFGDRLLSEVRRIAPKEAKLRIWAPPDRHLSAWTGGSILAALASFSQLWISKEEYAADGPSVVFRKTF